MDRFGRRSRGKGKARSALVFLLAFGLCAGCFLALFIFGNAGALWVLGIYAFGLTLWILVQGKDAEGNNRLWLSSLKVQSPQGPGFSALEVEAINAFLAQIGPEMQDLRSHFAGSEVVSRYNSGAGGVTRFHSATPRRFVGDLERSVSWFEVEGIRSVVGARFWADDDGMVTLLEFFVGGENTARVVWTEAPFRPAGPERERPSIPQIRPIESEPRWVRYRPDF